MVLPKSEIHRDESRDESPNPRAGSRIGSIKDRPQVGIWPPVLQSLRVDAHRNEKMWVERRSLFHPRSQLVILKSYRLAFLIGQF